MRDRPSPGLGIIGFTQYTTRPQPNGPDQTVILNPVNADGGGIVCYPPLAYDQPGKRYRVDPHTKQLVIHT